MKNPGNVKPTIAVRIMNYAPSFVVNPAARNGALWEIESALHGPTSERRNRIMDLLETAPDLTQQIPADVAGDEGLRALDWRSPEHYLLWKLSLLSHQARALQPHAEDNAHSGDVALLRAELTKQAGEARAELKDVLADALALTALTNARAALSSLAPEQDDVAADD